MMMHLLAGINQTFSFVIYSTHAYKALEFSVAAG